MAWRLRTSVVRGEIDNRTKGKISGKIWLAGRNEPVVLDLEGNGYRDVAGCLVVFENPDPQVGDEHTDLFAEQKGAIGDYTASRKVRAFDVPLEEALEMIRCGETPPEHMANCLYLEWFSERNGRVVIESYDYKVEIVDTAWSLDEAGEEEQRRKNADSMAGFMQQLGEILVASGLQDGDEPPYDPEDDEPMDEFEDDEPMDEFEDDEPMDEFEWERFMKQADKQAEKYGKLLEKYRDHPDRDQIVAREMGWDDLADDLEAYDKAVGQGEIEPLDFGPDGSEEPVPNPLTEGVDWVRNEYGRPVHPLQLRATKTLTELWRECGDAGLLEEGAENGDLNDMLFKGQCVGVELAGALNSLAYDRMVDNAFVVANLKRSLPHFNDMIQALEKVRKQGLLPEERLKRFSNDMFAIRADIVSLMDRFRKGIG